jgi:ADP-dependent NAD(P)H-hydrate dehydratase / NAD(P)H-hydrate epimerase
LAPETRRFIQKYIPWLKDQKKPFILDADGLKLAGEEMRTTGISFIGVPCVFTPHVGELKALTEFDVIPDPVDIEKRAQFLIEKQAQIGGIILLKGLYDYIIGEIEGKPQFCVNALEKTTPEMSVGGTGDVLAGLVGAMIAIGTPPFESACAAAYLNGILGARAKSNHGARINALDLISEIRPYLKSKNL